MLVSSDRIPTMPLTLDAVNGLDAYSKFYLAVCVLTRKLFNSLHHLRRRRLPRCKTFSPS
jgi:hypothetical protein